MVLYQLTFWQFLKQIRLLWMLAAVFIVALCWPRMMKTDIFAKWNEAIKKISCGLDYKNDQLKNFLQKFFAIFLGVCVVIAFAGNIGEYIDLRHHIAQGDYFIVEGEVERFEPRKKLAQGGKETLMIDQVFFQYSGDEVTIGYNRQLCDGGVITGNGQRLKVGYVPYKGENRIVYIEQIE